jgi:hypothetical protein
MGLLFQGLRASCVRVMSTLGGIKTALCIIPVGWGWLVATLHSPLENVRSDIILYFTSNGYCNL